MAVVFSNNAVTTLASSVSTSATSITVVDGSVFPDVSSASDHTYITFEDVNSNREIVKLTNRSGNTLTVVRGQDGTTAQSFSSGDKVELRITAVLLNEIAAQADTDTNTEYTAGSGLTLSGTTFSNTAPDQTVSLTGSGATTISGTYPNFTVSSTDTNTDTNTTYTAGSGLNLSGTTFSNTAPDQTVSLTGSGATTISGTYPNFTISSTDTTPDPLRLSNGSASAPSYSFSSDTDTGMFRAVESGSNYSLVFANGGTEAVRIGSSGGVGIGTDQIINTTGAKLTITVPATSPPPHILFYRKDSNPDQVISLLRFGNNSTNSAAKLIVNTDGDNHSGRFEFWTQPSSGSGLARLTIDKDGHTDVKTGDLTVSSGNLNIADSKYIQLGASNDLRLYHDSNDSYLEDQGDGSLIIKSDGLGIKLQSKWAGTLYDVIDALGFQTSIKSYGTTRLDVTNTGISVTGAIAVTSTVDGRDVATDGTKLDTIATNADVTPSWVPSSDPSYATQSYVGTAVSNLVDSAPSTLDTLNELAAALGDDANFSTTITTSIGTKWTQDNTKISQWDTAYGWGDHSTQGYITSADGGNADTVDGFHASSLMNATGTIFSNASNWSSTIFPLSASNTLHWNTVHNSTSSWTDSPQATFSSAYTYGGVENVRLNNMQIQTYYPHSGSNGNGVYYRTGWQSSGSSPYFYDWRVFLDSGNVSTYAWTSSNDGSGSGLDADMLDGVNSSSFLRSDAQDSGGPSASNYLNIQYLYNNKLLIGNGTTAFTDAYNDSPWYGIGRTNVDGWYSGQNKAQMAFYWGLVLRSAQSRIELGPASNGPILFGDGGTTNYAKINSTGIYQGTSNLVWHAGNDGSGSGLDADLLDGQHGSYYLNYNNFSNTPSIPSVPVTSYSNGADNRVITGTSSSGINGESTFTYNGTSATLYGSGLASEFNVYHSDGDYTQQVGYGIRFSRGASYLQPTSGDSKTLFIGGASPDAADWVNVHVNVQGNNNLKVRNNTVWNAGNDGSGSGLDADLLDGQHGSYYLNYNNFSNTPSIPSVGDGTLTILPGNSLTGSGTFTANQSGNTTITLGIDTPDDAGSGGWYDVVAWNNGLIKDAAVEIHGAGYLMASYLNMTHGVGNRTTDSVFYSSYDGYIRKNDASGFRTSLDVYNKSEVDALIPSVPSVGNGTLTINTSGSASGGGTFTANQSGNTTINISATDTTANQTITLSGHAVGSGTTSIPVTVEYVDSKLDANNVNLNNPPNFPASGSRGVVGFYNAYFPTGSGNISNYNAPLDGGQHYHMQQFNGYSTTDSSWSYQIAHSFYNSGMFHRNQNNGTWQAWRTLWDSLNDGSGSGLDADLLDGQHGSYYLNYNNFSNTPSIPSVGNGTLTINTSGSASGGGTFTANQSGNSTITITGTGITSETDTLNTVTGRGSTTSNNVDFGNVIVGGVYSNNHYNSTTSPTYLSFGGGNDLGNYSIGTSIENYGGHYTKLNIRWHTGIRIGAQAAYGGVRIFNNEDFSTLLFSVGKGDTNTRVESGALYVGTNVAWHAGNDGSGSGLDADTVDGLHASSFLTGNQTITLTGPVTGSGTTSISTSNLYQNSVVFGGSDGASPDSSMEYQQTHSLYDTKLAPDQNWNQAIRMAHGDPYNYYSSTLSMQMTGSGAGKLRTQLISSGTAQGWRTVWDNVTDGSGSGLDADTLDGQHGSYYAAASSIPSVGNGTITINAGTNMSGGGTFTVNQSGNTTITLNSTASGGGSTFNGGDITGASFTMSNSSAKLGVRKTNPAAALDVNGAVKSSTLNVGTQDLFVVDPYVKIGRYGDGDRAVAYHTDNVAQYGLGVGTNGKIIEDIVYRTYKLSQAKMASTSNAHVVLPLNLPNNPSPVMATILHAWLYVDNEAGQGAAMPNGQIKLFYRTDKPSGVHNYSEWGKIIESHMNYDTGSKKLLHFHNNSSDIQQASGTNISPHTTITLYTSGSGYSGGNNTVNHYIKLALKLHRGNTDFKNNPDLITVT